MVTEKDLEKISKLSKIEIDDEGKTVFLAKLNKIFDWIDVLNEVDISGVDVNCIMSLDKTPERSDNVIATNSVEEVLENAKDSNMSMFAVPRVVE